MLEVKGLQAWYGKSHILHGVDLRVGAGEIVSLLGRNGVGRSTTVRALMGHVKARGSAKLNGRELLGMAPYRVAHMGLGYVPENRDVFPRLTVAQNLALGVKSGVKSGGGKRKGGNGANGAKDGGARWTQHDFEERFPILRERANSPAGVLSGGEQQILSLCRTLMGDPALVMVDEPTEGLAPKIVQEIGRLLADVAARGTGVLLVEQKLDIALELSQRVVVMGHGRIVFEGSPSALTGDAELCKEWLGV